MEKTQTIANPAPLGLLGFGSATFLLNLHNIGLYDLNNMIIMMGIFYGGAAQFIAGLQESKRNNTFGAAAFTSYGFFWWSLVAIWIVEGMGYMHTDSVAMGSYMFVWGLITLIFFIGTFNSTRISQFVFGSLTILFALLGFKIILGVAILGKIAGVVGILAGLGAMYEAAALILNEKYNKKILPM